MTVATLTPAAGVGAVTVSTSLRGIPRAQYIYESDGLQNIAVLARALYEYESDGLQAIKVLADTLYLYESDGLQALLILMRAHYLYEATTDGEVFPWLMDIQPRQQYRGGTIDLYGDGFGEFLDAAAAATITVDSVNNGYVAANAVDATNSSWISNSNQNGAWIRFTFAVAKVISVIVLEGGGNNWGVPEFRFSDGLGNVTGSGAVAGNSPQGAEYPLGVSRTAYVLPTPRTTTYVEIRVSGGGGTTFIGFAAVRIYEDAGQGSEGASIISNLGLAAQVAFGAVGTWLNRSPNLWPANSGVPIQKALTGTVVPAAQSGLVKVEETL